MHRFAAILLAGWFLALGTGALEYLHNLEHAHADGKIAAAAQDRGESAPDTPLHNDNNCPIHAQLHLPLMTSGWAPLLILLGLMTAFVVACPASFVSIRLARRITCRGPPAAWSISPCVV